MGLGVSPIFFKKTHCAMFLFLPGKQPLLENNFHQLETLKKPAQSSRLEKKRGTFRNPGIFISQLMVNWWFGLVVWMPWDFLRDC